MHRQGLSRITKSWEQCTAKMIKAVVFDLDGTLANVPINYEKLFEEFRKIMNTNNIRPLAHTVSKVNEATRKQVFKAWDAAELAVSKKITLNDKGIGVYRKFTNKPKALVTMQGKKVVKIILEKAGLAFESIVTREDTLSRVEQIEKATKSLGAQHEEVLFVGNTNNDSIAAKKLGCHFLKIE
jgi:HAD superfamily hydrolase (TIGR01549 family)